RPWVPFERFNRLPLSSHKRCLIFSKIQVEPVRSSLRCENNWSPIMYIDHSLVTVSSDDHKPITFLWTASITSELTNPSKVHWLSVFPVNVIGLLLLRIIRVLHPLIPAIRWNHTASGFPNLFEEFTRGRSLATGVDGWRRVPFAQNGAHPHGTKFHRRPSGSKCRMRTLDRGATLKRPTDSGSVPPTRGTWSPIGWRSSQGGLYWEKRPHIFASYLLLIDDVGLIKILYMHTDIQASPANE